jgi:hypothetical protein
MIVVRSNFLGEGKEVSKWFILKPLINQNFKYKYHLSCKDILAY